MNPTPKTIQIFLPDGDPQGIRVAEITTRIVQVIEVPRSLLHEFSKMPESNQVALYFLIGEEADDADQKVYIGQTGDLRARLATHNKNKAFWQRTLVVISRTNSLTQTHALFLEWYCLQATRKAERYSDENANDGSKPHTPAPLEADCLEIFDTAKILLATLGYPLFDSVVKPKNISEEQDIFYCKASGTDGRGLYTPEGFVVLKGSVGRKKSSPSLIGRASHRRRENLLKTGIVIEQGETIVFRKDHLFSAPSMAAIALVGRAANGWVTWKNQAGQTLDKVIRQVDHS